MYKFFTGTYLYLPYLNLVTPYFGLHLIVTLPKPIAWEWFGLDFNANQNIQKCEWIHENSCHLINKETHTNIDVYKDRTILKLMSVNHYVTNWLTLNKNNYFFNYARFKFVENILRTAQLPCEPLVINYKSYPVLTSLQSLLTYSPLLHLSFLFIYPPFLSSMYIHSSTFFSYSSYSYSSIHTQYYYYYYSIHTYMFQLKYLLTSFITM